MKHIRTKRMAVKQYSFLFIVVFFCHANLIQSPPLPLENLARKRGKSNNLKTCRFLVHMYMCTRKQAYTLEYTCAFGSRDIFDIYTHRNRRNAFTPFFRYHFIFLDKCINTPSSEVNPSFKCLDMLVTL